MSPTKGTRPTPEASIWLSRSRLDTDDGRSQLRDGLMTSTGSSDDSGRAKRTVAERKVASVTGAGDQSELQTISDIDGYEWRTQKHHPTLT